MSRSAHPSLHIPGCLSKAEYPLHSGLTKVCRVWATIFHLEHTPAALCLIVNFRSLHSQLLPYKVLQALNVHEAFSTGLSQGQRAISTAGNVISGVHSVTISQP